MSTSLRGYLKDNDIDFEEEVFKPVTYPMVRQQRYEISNYGILVDTTTGEIIKPNLLKRHNQKHWWLCYAMLQLSDAKGLKKIKVPVHTLVGWEHVETLLDRSISSVFHEDLDPHNNYYKNLRWVPCYFRDAGDEVAYMACILRRDHPTISHKKITEITGMSETQLKNLFAGERHPHVREMFDLDLKVNRMDIFDADQRLSIQRLIALNTSPLDICEMFGVKYTDEAVDVIDHQRENLKKKQKKGEIPAKGDYDNPLWKKIAKEDRYVVARLAQIENDKMVAEKFKEGS